MSAAPLVLAQDFAVADHWPDSAGVFVSGSSHVIGHDDGVPNNVATGTDMYQNFREPVSVRMNNGRVLVLCHAGNRHSWPERSGQDLAVTYSDDGGQTWAQARVAGEHGNYSMQSHGLVYDAQIDRVMVLYTLYRWDYAAINGRGTDAARPAVQATLDRGEMLHRQYMIYSDDHGETWSEPRDITHMMPAEGENGHFGACEGRQLTLGDHAGRLLLTGGLRYEADGGSPSRKDLFVWISDDHGETWRKSESILETENERNYSCEARVTELPDGSLLYNQRTRHTGRVQARSTDGGETWTQLEQVPQLKASQCNGSMLTLRNAEGNLTDTLLCSLPTPGGRSNGVIYVSIDGGRTWPVRHDMVAGSFAYSSLVQIDTDTVALFYETNHYRDINVMLLPVDKLLED